MGNRKQPFGYRMKMGEVVLHAQEAKLVEYIFQQYLSGASFNILVAQLREQPIPYDEGKLWNKNMVARILEDHRYTGEGAYPVIIDQETLRRVLEKRSAKQAPAQKTEVKSAPNPSAGGAKGIGYLDGSAANRRGGRSEAHPGHCRSAIQFHKSESVRNHPTPQTALQA